MAFGYSYLRLFTNSYRQALRIGEKQQRRLPRLFYWLLKSWQVFNDHPLADYR